MKKTKTAVKALIAKHIYTEAELIECEIADQEIDVRCAIRDGQLDYAKQCEAKIERLKKELVELHKRI